MEDLLRRISLQLWLLTVLAILIAGAVAYVAWQASEEESRTQRELYERWLREGN